MGDCILSLSWLLMREREAEVVRGPSQKRGRKRRKEEIDQSLEKEGDDPRRGTVQDPRKEQLGQSQEKGEDPSPEKERKADHDLQRNPRNRNQKCQLTILLKKRSPKIQKVKLNLCLWRSFLQRRRLRKQRNRNPSS